MIASNITQPNQLEGYLKSCTGHVLSFEYRNLAFWAEHENFFLFDGNRGCFMFGLIYIIKSVILRF